MLTPTEARMGAEWERAEMLRRRMEIADTMLAKLADDIGQGAGVASLRAQVIAIKHELRGLRRTLKE